MKGARNRSIYANDSIAYAVGAIGGCLAAGAFLALVRRATSSATPAEKMSTADENKSKFGKEASMHYEQAALVTGGSSGIGRAVCIELARAGRSVVIHFSKNSAGAHETARLCSMSAARPDQHFLVLRCDFSTSSCDAALAKTKDTAAKTVVSTSTMVAQAAARIREVTSGSQQLRVLVNNAGVYEEIDMISCSDDEWGAVAERSHRVNFQAPLELTRSFAKHVASLRAPPSPSTTEGQGTLDSGALSPLLAGRAPPPPIEGAIVNVSSRGAYRGEPMAPTYGAYKAALCSLTQSMAQLLGKYGIVVAAVAPGFVDTPMAAGVLADPVRARAVAGQSSWERVATAGEVAAAVAFLASGSTPFATGTVIDVNGASHLR